MVDQYRTIIGFQYEGQGEVQRYLDALSTVAQRTASMQGVLSRPAEAGAFAGVTAADIGAAVQGYDVILRKQADLQKARLAQTRMEATLERRGALDPGHRQYIDPRGALAQEMRLGAASRIDRAAEQLANALLKQARETDKAAAAAQRAALLGPGADFQGRPVGPFAQAQQRLLQAAADGTLRAKQEERDAAREAAAIEKRRVAAARATQMRTAAVTGGGTFGSDFMTGFHGRADRPYAEQLGQAFKFSVFYGTAYKLLFAFTTTLQQTVQEGIEFQKAMTELKIASGQSADAANDIAQSLSAEATAAGAAPSQGVMLGARSLGLFGATAASGASAAEQERIAEISARVVSRMALGSKTDPMELQTQIAAVANAFGGGAQGQIRAYDLDAYLGRRFGVMPGETIQSVAESGTVGQAAGFNQEEVFAIAAALQSRTGQTSSAVAGWMAQIFSRGGEGTLTALTGRFGIDQSADLATQIEELAQIYKTATNAERAEIAAGFGRGKVQNAAVVMLDEFDTIMREARSARTGATGEGDRIFELRMSDIGGQIQETIAVMKAFASELGRSGVLDVLGGVIVAFRELVRAATDVLEIWNELPGVVKGAIASLVLFSNATRIAAALGGASLVSRAGAVGTTVGNAMGVAGPATQAAAGTSGLLAAGKAALRVVGPFAGATAALLAISALKSSSDRMREAQEAATTALQSSGLTPESTSSDYISSASELDMLAQQNREATGWFHNFITAGQANNDNIELARQLEIEADRRRRVADAIDARAAANPIKAPAIADFQADTIKEALDLVTASGGDANDRLRLLTDALDGTGDAAVRAAAAIDEDFAGRMATLFKDGVAGITEAIPMSERVSTRTQLGTADARRGVEYQVEPDSYTLSEESVRIPGETRTIGEVFQATQTELENRLREELTRRNIDSLADLDRGTSKELAESIVEDSDFDERLSGDDLADARKRIVNMIARQLRGEALQWRKMLKKNHDLTAEEVAAIGESIDTEFEASREDMPEFDLAGRAASWRRQLAKLNETRSQAGADEDISALMRRIGRAKAGLARTEIERLDQVRRAAQQNATSAAQIRRIGMRTIRGRVAAAIESGDVDVLAEVISNSGKVGVRIARKAIDVAIAAAREAIQIQAAYAAIQSYAAGVAGMISGIAGSMDAMGELAGLQELSSALGNMAYGSAEETLQGTDVEGTDKYFPDPEKKKSPEDRKAEREQARQEMLDLKNNLYLLSIDLSDPLALAVAAVKDARRRLQSDIASGQDRATIAASRVALRQAEIEREATAFQQRLEAMQTAEELGRISHRKYISYLESERKRLGAIKDRTYQQQQQLDEIDRLMKDAAEQMQGQWNFGDIKLPTPYQVRRQVEQMRLDRATQLDATSGRVATSVTTINIDGADVGKVRQIITETLGRSNQTVTTRPRRR